MPKNQGGMAEDGASQDTQVAASGGRGARRRPREYEKERNSER